MTDAPFDTRVVRAIGLGYHGEFRFLGQDWRTVCDSEGPIIFVTAGGASGAASAVARHVREHQRHPHPTPA